MNDRIKELAEQASTVEDTYPEGNYGYPTRLYKFNKAKFAQLIIDDCIAIIFKEQEYGEDRHDDYNLGLYEAYREIKEHFGIK